MIAVQALTERGNEMLVNLLHICPTDLQTISVEKPQKPAPIPQPVVSGMPTIDISNLDSPNCSIRGATISAIVLHNTCGKFDGAISWLCNPNAQTSAHLVISRDGRVACLVPFSKKAWHAGNGNWNAISIGIELEADYDELGLTPVQQEKLLGWLAWFQVKYSIATTMIRTHRTIVETDCPCWIWPTENDFLSWRKLHLGA